MPPLVSIGLPARNGENLLRRAINSLLRQEHENLELVLSGEPMFTDYGPTTLSLPPAAHFRRYCAEIHSGRHVGGMFCGVYRRAALGHYLFVNMIIGGARSLVPQYLKDLGKRILGRGETKPLH